MDYQDRFSLTPEESIFLAKKKWDENVYCGMRMENRAVTFPQTKTILDGVNVPDVQLDDIQAILNMRDVWRYLLSTVDQPVTLEYLCTLNGYIARNEALVWGELRTGRVGISGTDYLPPLPSQETAERELSEILKRGHVRDRQGSDGVSVGYKSAAVLERQQAHEHDAGEQDTHSLRRGDSDCHRQAHGAVQHSASRLLRHRRG